MSSVLELSSHLPLHAMVAGIQVPSGATRHMDRIISCFDLLFVSQGCVPIQEEERAYELKTGQTLILWPGRHHWGTSDYEIDTRMYWMHFTLEETSELSEKSDVLSVPQYATAIRPNVLEEMFRRFIEDQRSGRLLQEMANLMSWMILGEIADQRPVKSAADSAIQSSESPAERALAYINAYFHMPLTVAEVATELGYNPDYLNRVFRQNYERTLIEEIHRARIEHARHLLIYGSDNLDEIAKKCGFNEASYLSRLFKRYEGVTPSAFRRLNARRK